MSNYWIWPVSEENWDIVRRDLVWATYSRSATEKVRDGDEIAFYVIGRGVFGGILRVKGDRYRTGELRWADERREGQKIYPYEVKLEVVRLGEASVRNLRDRLSFLKDVEHWTLRLRGSQGGPANNGNPISREDRDLLLSELGAAGPLPPEPPPMQVGRPSHDELKSMLKEVGEVLCFISRTEDYSPNGTYRYDVTWRDYEDHRPMKVFEVELSGNVDRALSSLSHAFDMWGSEQLYLIIEDEADALRAERLVMPRVRGAFVRIKDRLRVLSWIDVKKFYEALTPHRDLLRDLARR